MMNKITYHAMNTTMAFILIGGLFVTGLYSLFDGQYVAGMCYVVSLFILVFFGYKSSADLAKEHRKQAIRDHIQKGDMK